MLTTPLCDLFGIEVPIILAPMGTCTSAELAAAASNAGGLGGIGTLFRSFAAVKRDIDMMRTAAQAAERGADVISAQGSEAGGYCGDVSTMTLVPQVVDAVAPIPVVASGGIFDGRGIAAALMLGAACVNLGTRFIASKEAPASREWKDAIVSAKSEHAIKAEVLNEITPLPGTAGFKTLLRSLPTNFLNEWSAKREQARRECERLRGQIVSTTQAGRQHECLLTAGQTAGGIKDILSVDEIMRKLVAEAETALSRMRLRGEQAPPLRTRLPSDETRVAAGIMEEVPEPDSLGG